MRRSLYGAAVVICFSLTLGSPATASDDPGPLMPRTTSSARLSPDNEPAMADFETLNFRAAAACSPCHSASGAEGLESPRMYDQWSPSIMAYGSKDPFWQAKVRSEVLRASEHRSFIEKKCSTCHTPMATTEAKLQIEPPDEWLFGSGFLNPANPLNAAAMDAISCTLCHRIEDSEDLGTDDGFSGAYTIDPVDEPVDRPLYGPYADTFNQPMQDSVGMLNRFGQQINDPAMCATCHNLKTPFLNAEGEVVGLDFPEQTPFSEWQASDFAHEDETIGCQQCHMPLEDQETLARRPNWLEKRDRASHAFTSVNTETLSLLAAEADHFGDDPRPLLESVEDGREFLTHAGTLEFISPSLENGVLDFGLLVGNLTGHKLPTAFPSRRVYVHVMVRNVDEEIVFESGRMMDDGRIEGVDSDDDPETYEPHHTTITSWKQVQVYEAILGTTDDDVTYTLLRAGQYLKDNRIVPSGFDKWSVSDDIRPVGLCMDDDDFAYGSDEITYSIDGLTDSSYTVSVELRHQAIGYPYVGDLREFTDDAVDPDPVISRFLDLYDTVQPGSELIAEAGFEIGDSSDE